MTRTYLAVVGMILLLCATASAELRVALVGAEARTDAMNRWATIENADLDFVDGVLSFRTATEQTVVSTPRHGATVAEVANLLYQADVAVIVIDSLEGPLPINRYHTIVTRQAGVAAVTVMFANLDRFAEIMAEEAAELLEHEDEAVRELLSVYEVGDENLLVFTDSTSDEAGYDRATTGLAGAEESLLGLDVRRGPRAVVDSVTVAAGAFYLLTHEETMGHGLTIDAPLTLEFWSEGFSANVEASAEQIVRPGDNAELVILSDSAFRGTRGSRTLLIQDGRLVAVGVIAGTAE